MTILRYLLSSEIKPTHLKGSLQNTKFVSNHHNMHRVNGVVIAREESFCANHTGCHKSCVLLEKLTVCRMCLVTGQTIGNGKRKLAFHEPRPCPHCQRIYRDAATLRTHVTIMHKAGTEPFVCTCGALFDTKYSMYTHRKNGHR